jgi:hypothetical protein
MCSTERGRGQETFFVPSDCHGALDFAAAGHDEFNQSIFAVVLEALKIWRKGYPLYQTSLQFHSAFVRSLDMRGVPHKLLVFVLAAGLIVAGHACSHAQMGPCGSAASHEANAVQNYADLNVDPGDEASSNETTSPVAHHHDDDLCKKCCAACVGASLVPAAPLAVVTLAASQQLAQVLSDSLAARSVPTEPGIPKGL